MWKANRFKQLFLLAFSFLWLTVFSQPGAVLAQASPSSGSLKIALLPILDSLPFYVAEANGYFKTRQISVEVIPVTSGLERDQLMQAGAIDGMLNEMMTTVNFNRSQTRVKILITARNAHADFPMFRLLSAPGSGITKVEDLAGVPIGISKNTIIEYVTDRLLTAKGLRPEQIKKKVDSGDSRTVSTPDAKTIAGRGFAGSSG